MYSKSEDNAADVGLAAGGSFELFTANLFIYFCPLKSALEGVKSSHRTTTTAER